jgi:TonB family protein
MKRSLYPHLIFGLVAIFAAVPAAISSAQEVTEMPLVESASMPVYPLMARAARIEGTVVLELTTDGTTISQIVVQSGPPMLAAAAKKNVDTWRLLPNKPMSFEVTFQFHLTEPASCYLENGTTTLKLPTSVEISVNAIQTCDPAATPETPEKQSRPPSQ